jgi:hypothetical protein
LITTRRELKQLKGNRKMNKRKEQQTKIKPEIYGL